MTENILATDRIFCRFARPSLNVASSTDIPEGGLCLSSFLLITEGDSDHVLMGHLDPSAPWDHIGALDSGRAATHSKGWMLPSSHLLLYESPQEAASRILKEQLGLDRLELSPPTVVAEVGTPRRFPTLAKHWDLEFIFRGKAPRGMSLKHDAWKELKFVDLKEVGKAAIARSHEDVLENAGFSF